MARNKAPSPDENRGTPLADPERVNIQQKQGSAGGVGGSATPGEPQSGAPELSERSTADALGTSDAPAIMPTSDFVNDPTGAAGREGPRPDALHDPISGPDHEAMESEIEDNSQHMSEEAAAAAMAEMEAGHSLPGGDTPTSDWAEFSPYNLPIALSILYGEGVAVDENDEPQLSAVWTTAVARGGILVDESGLANGLTWLRFPDSSAIGFHNLRLDTTDPDNPRPVYRPVAVEVKYVLIPADDDGEPALWATPNSSPSQPIVLFPR